MRCETVRRCATPLLPVLLLNAIALPATAGILTDIADQYQTASAGWMTAALHYANHLFFLLVSIEIAVTAIYHMLSREEFVAFLIALFIKLLGIGFFYVLLVEAPAWIPTLIQSFTQVGAGIGGTPVLDPSGVLSQGIDVGKTVLQGINFPDVFDHLLTVLVAGLSAIIVVFAYAIVAAQLLVALVESYIVIGGGVLMLGFAGTRWTLVFTERYLGYLVSVGIKLFVLYLIIGLGLSLGPLFNEIIQTAKAAAGVPPPSVYLDVMGGAIVFMILTWMVPALASSLMAGAPVLTLGGAASTALMTGSLITNAVTRGIEGGRTLLEHSKSATQSLERLLAATNSSDTAPAAPRMPLAAAPSGGGGGPSVRGRLDEGVPGDLSQTLRERIAQTADATRAPNAESPTPSSQSDAPAPHSTEPQKTEPAGIEDPQGQGRLKDTREARPVPARQTPRRRFYPPPMPHDHGHGGGLTIRLNLPE